VKLGNPALLIFIEGLVVQMRVTDENIVHGNKCLTDKWLGGGELWKEGRKYTSRKLI
jgi:hypothetical protein